MIKTLSFILFFTLNSIVVKAQDSINVTITGSCNQITGEFAYDGTLNGKNNYTREYTDGTGTFYFHVSYDNTKWVLYVDEAINEKAFYNLTVPNEMLPPNTGWLADICSEGTMFIEGGISVGSLDYTIDDMLIYLTSDNILKIELNDRVSQTINVDLYNTLGKHLLSDSIKPSMLSFDLDLKNLRTGIYIVSILNKKKKIFVL